MKLRTQILFVLLLFALLPLVVTVLTNLPRVLELLSSFNRQVYLQDLRSDFRDLDEHLVSRQEMLKLLAKLPEPGIMLGQEISMGSPAASADQTANETAVETAGPPDADDAQNDYGDDEAGHNLLDDDGQADIDLARAHYTEWINRILPDQLDVIDILFLDQQGQLRFWLERDKETREWRPTLSKPVLPPKSLIEQTLSSMRPTVHVSSVQINPSAKAKDPRRFMNLHITSPLGFVPGMGPTGAVMMAVDVGGMAQRFNETLWAYDDGRYLEVSRQAETGSSAFKDFPGIEEQFATGKLFLWQTQDGRQLFWVPLIQTASSGPLWVGREVDFSPLTDFRTQLILRVGGIVLVLTILAWVAARWFALRADKVGYQLTDGITRLLADDDKVAFNWKWTDELQSLGEKLTRLAKKHVHNNRRLVSHARELEESNRYKSQFLANVSHELRTPLNSILLLSKMLAEKNDDLAPENLEQAKVIHRASKDLKNLIDDILDLSKIEAGRAALNLENVDLREILKELSELMMPQFDEKDLYLHLDIEDGVDTAVNTDPDKLRQILKNFLSNAVKFTADGGVTVSIENDCPEHLEGEDLSEKWPLCIKVRDTGIGIAADKHDLVFQAFKQADGSTSRRYGGTGLGLSISRELAQLLGGKISLQSQQGEGAVFSLLLPRVFDRETLQEEQLGVDEPVLQDESLAVNRPDSPDSPDSGDQASADQLTDKTSFKDRHALIIDHEVHNLLLLTTLLESWGFDVTGAGDREEALESLKEEKIDVVLMDIMMPTIDGYDTMKQIRQEFGCAEMPIVALTSQADEQQKQACLQGGASEYLVKPVEAGILKSSLQKLLAP